MPQSFWIVVLIKDFTTAKSRLAPVLGPVPRRRLAEMTAARALDAALALAPRKAWHSDRWPRSSMTVCIT